METVYLTIVGILCLLAISDLIVGVSNDAVNFLNSAIGAKAAPFKVIMLIAALGILVGATFSSGMMEVARKGIFHPEHFFFSEIMIIFLAVMITDVILLDAFNTLGLPTSTTVSIVFELLGAAVAVSLIKIYTSENALELSEYINTAKAMAIIGGILLSVVVAFTIGALVQYLTRIIFTFNYVRNMKYFGAIWGGIAITAITYFILVKGAKGSSFISKEQLEWIKSNTLTIIMVSFAGWAILLQLLNWIVRLDILKLVVFVGTFALAMAFAGNDLVNFIGVPLAGLKSFEAWQAAGNTAPEAYSMVALTGKVKTDTYRLLIAGLIMVATLWLSKKAKSVVKTSLDLSRQDEGAERFGSSFLARSIVRSARTIGSSMNLIMPKVVSNKISERFDQTYFKENAVKGPDAPAFDMIRASVNLTVASILISFATSLKLPLSTTYVTFMVAMGTSLADRAWGRESAVYRITGVLSVVGGWFFTALSAFIFAFIVALIISFGGFIAVGGLILLAFVVLVRTHIIHKKKTAEQEDVEMEEYEDVILADSILEKCSLNVVNVLSSVTKVYNESLEGLAKENRKLLKDTTKQVETLNKKTKQLKDNIYKTVKKLEADSIDTGLYYVQVLDYLRETAHCLTYIATPSFEHIDNQHTGLLDEQIDELNSIKTDVTDILNMIIQVINDQEFSKIDLIIERQQEVLDHIEAIRKSQMKRIKGDRASTRNSLLYLNIQHETKNMLLYAINLVKAQRDFVKNSKK